MLSRLPTSDHLPSPSAGLCLAGAALLLIPVDLALYNYGADHPDVFVPDTRIEGQTTRGVETDIESEERIIMRPLWADVARVAVPLLVVGTLAALGRIDRRDA